MRTKCRLLLLIWMTVAIRLSGGEPDIAFEKTTISSEYYSEGAGIGDFNRDGHPDVVCGPWWYEGPGFETKFPIYEGDTFPNDRGYSDSFFSFTHDINGDGWTDVVAIGFPGRVAHWFENPKAVGPKWIRHVALESVGTESPAFADITGDGQPEIICESKRRLGYAAFDPENPSEPWTFRAVSDPGHWAPFTHGLGLGDINGDGRTDMLTSLGWFEQPESLDAGIEWTPHIFQFCPGGAQMYAYDIDDDGDNDVITSMQAHSWGLAWFEQIQLDDGYISFRRHMIMPTKPERNPDGINFSQLHAVSLHDMDGDGLKDIVTGKCYWAHNGHDPGARDPAVLYWFKLVRDDTGVRFMPNRIDDDSGVGRQISIGHLNHDQHPDLVVANKKGIFAFVRSP
ncbi:MAG: VCBS repeat-containing protein [Planctomycetaceae bacterium]